MSYEHLENRSPAFQEIFFQILDVADTGIEESPYTQYSIDYDARDKEQARPFLVSSTYSKEAPPAGTKKLPAPLLQSFVALKESGPAHRLVRVSLESLLQKKRSLRNLTAIVSEDGRIFFGTSVSNNLSKPPSKPHLEEVILSNQDEEFTESDFCAEDVLNAIRCTLDVIQHHSSQTQTVEQPKYTGEEPPMPDT